MTNESESFDELSAAAQGKVADPAPSAVAAAAKRAQQAMESAKGLVAGASLDEMGARAAESASNLYRGGRDLLANEDLSKAADNLSAAVRKNPFAAVGIAFSAGLLLALLTRG